MRWSHLAVVVLLFASWARADEENIFDLGRRRPAEVVMTIGEDDPGEVELDSAMGRRLRGVLAIWRGSQTGPLRGTVPRDARTIGDPPSFEPICVAHVRYGRNVSRRVQIVRALDGTFVARELDLGEDGVRDVQELDRRETAALLMSLDQFRGSFGETPTPVAEVVPMEPPKTPGWVTFDQDTLSERFWRGGDVTIEGSMRFLDEENIWVRLPRGYDPRRPAGLLIWVSPTSSGQIPRIMWRALDELGMVAVGADDSGNDRLISDRYQLAFDGMATAMRRYHVDPRRVYVTGFSGGGRTASMLHGAFADVFAGSVPIGGANTYENVPTGTGRFWPAGYRRPPGDVLAAFRRDRMACITGDNDFNQANVQGVVRMLQRDGIEARVFDIAGLRHELPGEEDFLEAMSWVDEGYRAMRAEEEADAAEAMEGYRRRYGTDPVEHEGQRKVLDRVMEEGAWTGAAWEAAGLLGLEGSGGD